MIEMKSTNGYTFYISECDYEEVSKYRWYLDNGKRGGYLRRTTDKLFLHRFIMKPNTDEVIDHINHNKLDNTRENLRTCKRIDNCHNYELKDPIRNTGHNTWRFSIMCNGKHYHSPSYSTKEDAMIMYNRKSEELHGEFGFRYDIYDDGREIKSNSEKNKTSKHKNIGFKKTNGKWQIRIKGISYGFFDTEEEAYEFKKVLMKIW